MKRHLNFKAQPLSLINVFCSEGSPKTQLWSVRELRELTSVNEVTSELTLKHRLPQCGQRRREPAGPSSSPHPPRPDLGVLSLEDPSWLPFCLSAAVGRLSSAQVGCEACRM